MKTFETSENQSKETKSKSKRLSATEVRATFDEELRQMYWCEKQLAEVLPGIAKNATSYELTSAVLAHLAVTENQIIRLIHVFDVVGERAVGHRCDMIDQIIASNEKIQATESGFYRDTEIINATQSIMHHEITTYNKLFTLAVKLGEETAAEFLSAAVKEEKNAHSRLTEISLSTIYFDAAS